VTKVLSAFTNNNVRPTHLVYYRLDWRQGIGQTQFSSKNMLSLLLCVVTVFLRCVQHNKDTQCLCQHR